MVKRFEVYLVSLDPTKGREIKKTRPCLIISPNEMHGLNTYIIAPMTTKEKSIPTRIPLKFAKKEGFIALDQIRTIDRERLVQFLGIIDERTGLRVLNLLQEMFAP